MRLFECFSNTVDVDIFLGIPIKKRTRPLARLKHVQERINDFGNLFLP